MNPLIFGRSLEIANLYRKENIHRVTVSASTSTFKTGDFVESTRYMYRDNTAIDGGKSWCYDADMNIIENPIAFAEKLNFEIGRKRIDIRYWRLSVSPEFGFVVENLVEKVVRGIRNYSDRMGYTLDLLAVEHHDTPMRHVHVLIPEAVNGYDRNRHKIYRPIRIPFRRIVTDLKRHVGILIESEIGPRPQIPTLSYAIHEMRWTGIDDRIHYRMVDRIVDMNPNRREFKEPYQLVEHVEEVARLRSLVKMKFAKVVSKNSFLLLPRYEQDLIPTVRRGLDRPFIFSYSKKLIVPLGELERNVVLDTRLLTSRSLFSDPYEADHTTRRFFYQKQYHARTELNRDLPFMKVVGLTNPSPTDFAAMKMCNTYVLLSDGRTGYLRVAHLSDIDRDKAHILSQTIAPRLSELGIEDEKGRIFVEKIKDLHIPQEVKTRLEMEGDFLRRWRLYLDRGEERVEFSHHRKIEKLEVKNEHIQKVKNELKKEAVLEIGRSEEIAQEQELDPGLGLGDF